MKLPFQTSGKKTPGAQFSNRYPRVRQMRNSPNYEIIKKKLSLHQVHADGIQKNIFNLNHRRLVGDVKASLKYTTESTGSKQAFDKNF